MTVQQIPNLPVAVALSGSEQVEVVQAGVSMRASLTQIKQFAVTGFGSMALQNADNVTITGGSINGTSIGATSASTGSFSSLSASGTVSGAGFVALLAPYAPLNSPAFTGTPTAPTPVTADNSTKIATTAFVKSQGYLTSGTFGSMAYQDASAVAITGGVINSTPIGATTASTGAFTTLSASGTVSGAGFTALLAPYAPLNSPAFTGTPSLPTGTVGVTQTAGDSSTKLATTAFVGSAITALNLGTMSTQNANNVNITGGAINSTPIGATTRSTGAFTTLGVNNVATFTGSITATPASANIVLSPTGSGVVTINPATAGTMDNMNVGATTRGTGAFTTLVANSINSTPIGATTPSTGSFTTLAANGAATFTGSLTASPASANVTFSPTGTGTVTINPATLGHVDNTAIGATTPSTGAFTTLTATAINSTPIGATTPSTGAFTTLSASGAATFTNSLTASPANQSVTFSPTGTGTVTINPATTGNINNMTIGATTAAAGTFTNLTATGTVSGAGFTNLLSTYAKIDSQVFTGTPSLPTGTTGVTQTATDNTTKLATTAFVKSQNYLTANQSISLTGDVTGSGTTSIAATVVQLQGRPLAATAPTTGYVIGWNGTTWGPQAPAAAAAGGSSGQIQYNNGGVLGGVTDWSFSGGATGNFQPAADNVKDIGTSALRVHSVYTALIGSAANPTATTYSQSVDAGVGPLALNAPSGQTINFQVAGTTQFVISSSLGFYPQTDNVSPLGQVSKRFSVIYTGQIGSSAAPMVSSWSNTHVAYGSAPSIQINKTASGQSARIMGQTTSGNRWIMYMGDTTAEGGSNAGSDFKLERYTDGGALIDAPIAIVRSTGVATFSQVPVIPTTAPSSGGQIVSKSYADATYVPLNGSQMMTGDLTIYKTNPALVLSKSASGQSAILAGKTNGVTRWGFNVANSNAETGTANTGSDFSLDRYSDAGSFLDSPFVIARTSGGAFFGTTPTVQPPSGNADIILKKAASGSANTISGYTGSNIRWQIVVGGSGAESGSNAGSDFGVARYTDAGASIDTPFVIFRSSGAAQFLKTVSLNAVGQDAALYLNKPASGLSNVMWGQTNGANRWTVVPGTNESETGGNAGSNFSIARFTDAGAYVGEAFGIRRSDGAVSMYGPTTVNSTCNVTGALSVGNGLGVTGSGNFSGGIGCSSVSITAGTPQLWCYSSGAYNYITASDTSMNGGQYRNFYFRGIDAGGASEVNLDFVKFMANSAYVNGTMDAGACYIGRRGQWGSTGQAFSFWWDGSNEEAWISTTRVGYISLFSDYRIKKDVAPLPSMWERAKALKPISYTQKAFVPPSELEKARKKDANDPPMAFHDDDIERWGFVAHELQETLIPSAALGVKDDPTTIQTPNPWTVIAVLTKTLQEAMERIEALEARLNA